MAELTGQSFAGYEILAKLGEGGFGAVYKARQPALNRLVALKILASHLAADAEFVARFKREATLAASFNHPNLVLVYAAGESDGTHYMAMEFVEGETLRGRIEEHSRLQPREALAVAVYVAQALQYAWNKSHLIHRDIKPDNIFLSKTGEVKVGDLGLAKNVGQSTAGMTATGMMMGSPHYISPEQARGSKEIEFRADIYSLGCTLYHMLTGKPPYEGNDPMTVMGLHVNAPPPAMFKVWPQCPMPLALLVGKMLKKNPRERHASYDELIAELTTVHEKIKAAQTASAAPPSGTITFLFTDIEGSTQLWEKHPQAMPVALERHNQILRRTMESHGGFVFKTVGDAFCVAFASAPNAMAAALAAQRALAAEPWGETGPLRVRMALHTGAAEARDGDYFGPTLNRVARVLAAGHGGQILLSNATEQLVRDHLAEGVSLGDLGERSLKNLTRTERIFQINLPDLPTQFPTLRSVASHSAAYRRRRMMIYGGAGVATVVVIAGLLLWSPWKAAQPPRVRAGAILAPAERRVAALTANPKVGQVCTLNVGSNVTMDLMGIPPGEFMLGSTTVEQAWAVANGLKEDYVNREGEAPRKATIKQGLWLGRTEVTVGQWKQFVAATGYKTDAEKRGYADYAPKKPVRWWSDLMDGVSWRDPGFGASPEDNHAVSCVSWNDAVAFCEWMSERERKAGRLSAGQVIRLPTEAEWEYACRGGLPAGRQGTQTKFWWGESAEDAKGRVNSSGREDGLEFVAPVDAFGRQGRNKFGLADMLGNVWEWCLDQYDATPAHEEYYDRGDSRARVVRGGSCRETSELLRCAFRAGFHPSTAFSHHGFRVAVGADARTTASTSPAAASRGVDNAFIREVVALPAEQQVQRVMTKLKELNPGFDGKEKHKIENGVVTELEFRTGAVADISPVRALGSLRKLLVNGNREMPGLLSDLSPLKGMKLRDLSCCANQVSDLSPLKGMPLESFYSDRSEVSDLSPLRGMRLSFLVLANAPVSDLSPLEGMPLGQFFCYNTKVSDLSPLKGAHLGVLWCERTPVRDLSPLKGMPLRTLFCRETQITDLSPLKETPLKDLRCDFEPERDAEILRSIRTLEKINGVPAAKLLERVEAGQVAPGATTTPPAARRAGGTFAPAETRVGALTTNPRASEVFTLPLASNGTMELIGIPAGEFMMGSTPAEQVGGGNRNDEGERPRKTSIKNGFWLGRTEVTVGQWKQFAAATGYRTDAEKKGYVDTTGGKGQSWGRADGSSWRDPWLGEPPEDNHPVCCVTWNDAVAFCEWLTERERKAGRLATGQVVRLPTEAEWEYACRGGTRTEFWWGESPDDGRWRLNWWGRDDGFESVAPVDSYGERGRNGFGLADMLGNVYEWCLDDYDAKQAHEECYKGNSDKRVLRGGSFRGGAYPCANRHNREPFYSVGDFGFRVAVGLEPVVTTASAPPSTAPREGGIFAPAETRVSALTTNPNVGEVSAAALGARTGVATIPMMTGVSVMTDPINNLRGDQSYRFVDIIEASIERRADRYYLTVKTATPLPRPSETQGGKHVNYIFFIDADRNRATGQLRDGNEYNIHLTFDEKGWRCQWYKTTDVSKADGISVDRDSFEFATGTNTVTLSFPTRFLPSEHFDWWCTAALVQTDTQLSLSANPPTDRATFDVAAIRVPALTTNPKVGEVFTLPLGSNVTMELMGIPPGEFLLGSTTEEQAWAVANGLNEMSVKSEGEQPRKTRIKDGFWLGRAEVTVGQWKEFVAVTGYKTDEEKKGESNVPEGPGKSFRQMKAKSWRDPGFGSAAQDRDAVSCVSWNDAMAFCEWLTERERKAGRLAAGQVIRLPTEAEWEYACRAGTQMKFWWGESAEDGKGRLNWSGRDDGFEYVARVDSYGARGRNGFGLADMLGNVFEWCLDEYDVTQAHEECYKGNPGKRVLRGGSFCYDLTRARCAARYSSPPADSVHRGFRVAVGLNLSGATTSTAPTAETRVLVLTTNPKRGEVCTLEVGKGVTMELMGIPPGEFMLGSTKEEQAWAVANGAKEGYLKHEGEAPRKTRIKDGFWLGRTEVTVGHWKQFVTATGYKTDAEKKGYVDFAPLKGQPWGRVEGLSWRGPGFASPPGDNHPVCCVSWTDAMAFCEWLTERERKAGRLSSGLAIRLPTEAEWEYACRAGTQTKFWWGEDVEDGKGRWNWRGKDDGFEYVAPVGSFGERGRNAFGLADMLGNAWEWCLDEYDKTQAHEELWTGNPVKRVLRGGSFFYYPAPARCASRRCDAPAESGSRHVFRVAVGVDLSGATTAAASTFHSADDTFLREVAALPAEQQVARVVAKLKELNPGYDGQETHRIEKGQVVSLSVPPESSLSVSDISPIRALSRLTNFRVGGTLKKGRPVKAPLADLTPLQGLSLTNLVCGSSEISDLAPLKGMPLISLECGSSRINDLTPLRGMRLESLSCSGTRVSDLSPLNGMPLRYAAVGYSPVTDLSPLRDMPLVWLICSRTKVQDLSPLASMPLEELHCDFKPERDTAILRSIKTLKKINYLLVAEFWKQVEAGEAPQAK